MDDENENLVGIDDVYSDDFQGAPQKTENKAR